MITRIIEIISFFRKIFKNYLSKN